jgi:RNA polymerase sigma-70 factor, ECF subfamily
LGVAPAGGGALSDEALAARAAAGDVAAFSQLVRRHERRVRSFLERLTGGQGADDLAQESFLKAWRMAGSFRGEGSYEGWLLRIAWRQFLSSRRRVRELPTEIEPAGAPVDAAARIDIERALARLPERERAAALLCFGEGRSHAEAAAVLELPLGTLKSIVARARAELVRQLEGHGR